MANNLLHPKSASSAPLVLRRADELAGAYVGTRRSRFRVLVRQYIGSVIFQVMVHTGLLGTAGWLVAISQLTVGQLVAAEVVIVSLLVSLESVVKRVYMIHYFFYGADRAGPSVLTAEGYDETHAGISLLYSRTV